MGLYDKPVIWTTAKLYRDKRNPDKLYASVRSYIIEECLQQKKDLLIKYYDSYMLVTYPELVAYMKEKHQFHSIIFKEKFPPYREYKLVDFRWGRWRMLVAPAREKEAF